jgi:hypothetical protein
LHIISIGGGILIAFNLVPEDGNCSIHHNLQGNGGKEVKVFQTFLIENI